MALVGKDNKQKIWNYLKSIGLTDYAASGVMGCWESECHNNPNTVEGFYLKSYPGDSVVLASRQSLSDYTQNILFPAYDRSKISINKNAYKGADGYYYPGFGLAQWTGPRTYRLIQYAESIRMRWQELEAQLSFFKTEFDARKLLTKMNAAKSVAEATATFFDGFEMSAGASKRMPKKVAERTAHAEKFYKQYAGTASNGGNAMDENQLRQKVVDIAVGWLGCKESDGSHKKIIDTYNSHKPLARGYTVKYTDAWCSTYASAVAIKAGLTDIIPTECGCEKHIQLFKKMNSWVENDAYVPSPGDYVFYDWDDNGVGDCTGSADHVGIVVSVSNGTIKVIEGNRSNSVSYHDLKVNGKYIRGYGVPKYSSKVSSTTTNPTPQAPTPKPNPKPTGSTYTHTVVRGDTLSAIARKHGTSVAELVRINGIKNANVISVGQVIYLYEVAASCAKLAKLGVISSPDYWTETALSGKMQWLDTLIIQATKKITKAGTRTSTPEEGIDVMVKAGVINSPDYWCNNYGKIPSLNHLLMALGGALK